VDIVEGTRPDSSERPEGFGFIYGLTSKRDGFDSSAKHGGAPYEFPLGRGQVIKGWDEAIATMKVGGKRHLIIRQNWLRTDRDAAEHSSECHAAI
jgi:peptidylprolyl isomerase